MEDKQTGVFALEHALETINALEGHFPLILDNVFERIVFENSQQVALPAERREALNYCIIGSLEMHMGVSSLRTTKPLRQLLESLQAKTDPRARVRISGDNLCISFYTSAARINKASRSVDGRVLSREGWETLSRHTVVLYDLIFADIDALAVLKTRALATRAAF
ncbi:hypothetical protein BDD12DRAFT_875163 [Trichophaea hybrida]|nr:hypothetical protein BDD12DRAFT_875163 [Trichophaea hybrida]